VCGSSAGAEVAGAGSSRRSVRGVPRRSVRGVTRRSVRGILWREVRPRRIVMFGLCRMLSGLSSSLGPASTSKSPTRLKVDEHERGDEPGVEGLREE
jgi:hypothetical protein